MSLSVVLYFFLVFSCGHRELVRSDTGGTNTIALDKPSVPLKKGMVYVPAGWFRMSTGFENKGYRRVWLKPYYIDKTEVSNGQYARFIDAGGYKRQGFWRVDGWKWLQKSKVSAPRWWKEQRYRIGRRFPDYPVGGVSWYEADAYARWAGKRLPTEAEWERASRGDGARFFPWGNDPIYDDGKVFANFSSHDDGYIYAGPIRSYKQGKSPLGCWNMLGNVWEWVQDWHLPQSGYQKLPLKNPVNIAPGERKLLRGGSWYRRVSFYILYYRFKAKPGSRKYDDFGFRCAADVE